MDRRKKVPLSKCTVTAASYHVRGPRLASNLAGTTAIAVLKSQGVASELKVANISTGWW
jgi:hypothetical protein